MSKPIECTTPRINLKVNCGLWAIMMYQYRFISFNKYNTVVGDADNIRNCTYVGAGMYGKSQYLPLNSVVNINLLLKSP